MKSVLAGRSRGRPAKARALRRRVSEERRSVYRRAITEAAERLFATKGTAQARMQEIAAEAGISLGTLYAAIDSKESIFAEIHRTRMQGFYACICAARDAHDDTLASHLAVLKLGARYFLDRPDFLRMLCRDGNGWVPPFPKVGAALELWNEGASVPRDLFARGIAEGLYVNEDPELLVRKMLALKQVELYHWLEQGMVTDHAVILDRLESQFIRAFCLRSA